MSGSGPRIPIALALALGLSATAGMAQNGDISTIEWIRQFGSSGQDSAQGVAVSNVGGVSVYVCGWTDATLPGQTSSGELDAFARKYDSNGTVIWTRQFGSSGRDQAVDADTDNDGNLYVVGFVDGALPNQTWSGAYDAFVRKYDSAGTEQWTRQFGTPESDFAQGVAVDGSGNIYVAGAVGFGTALPGQTSSGGSDAFVRKYDSAGTEQWTRQFGSADNEQARGAAADGSGNVVVVGDTAGTLTGQTSSGGQDVFVRKYGSTGAETWTHQFGSSAWEYGYAGAIDGAGNVYAAGQTNGALPGQTLIGSSDAYVRKYDSSGTVIWTRQFGAGFSTGAGRLFADVSSRIYVAGTTTGALPGQTSSGSSDTFVRVYDQSGTEVSTRQFGGGSSTNGFGVSVDASGKAYAVGNTQGPLPGQTLDGPSDAFVVKLGPPPCGPQGEDIDRDNVPDYVDNCPTIYNPSQARSGGGGRCPPYFRGELCDDYRDIDTDGVAEQLDNCPNEFLIENGTGGFALGPCFGGGLSCTYNPDQQDSDGDGIGDVCDPFVSCVYSQTYCINGVSEGVGWSWWIDLDDDAGNVTSEPRDLNVPPVLPVGADAFSVACDFAESIGRPATRTENCFTIREPRPFSLRVGLAGSNPTCKVTAAGCRFNPLITLGPAHPADSISTLGRTGLILLVLMLASAGAVVAYRRRSS